MTRNAAILLLLRTELRDSVTCAFEMRHREQLSVCERRLVRKKIGSENEEGY
jgi:hypothetical protein